MDSSPRSHLEKQLHGLVLGQSLEPVEEIIVVVAAPTAATGRPLWALVLLAQVLQLGPFLGVHLCARAVDTGGAAPGAWRTCRLVPITLPAERSEVRKMVRVREVP